MQTNHWHLLAAGTSLAAAATVLRAMSLYRALPLLDSLMEADAETNDASDKRHLIDAMAKGQASVPREMVVRINRTTMHTHRKGYLAKRAFKPFGLPVDTCSHFYAIGFCLITLGLHRLVGGGTYWFLGSNAFAVSFAVLLANRPFPPEDIQKEREDAEKSKMGQHYQTASRAAMHLMKGSQVSRLVPNVAAFLAVLGLCVLPTFATSGWSLAPVVFAFTFYREDMTMVRSAALPIACLYCGTSSPDSQSGFARLSDIQLPMRTCSLLSLGPDGEGNSQAWFDALDSKGMFNARAIDMLRQRTPGANWLEAVKFAAKVTSLAVVDFRSPTVFVRQELEILVDEFISTDRLQNDNVDLNPGGRLVVLIPDTNDEMHTQRHNEAQSIGVPAYNLIGYEDFFQQLADR